MELSSEVPGTNLDWPSDITLWVNDVAVGTWTSPGDYGDKRGVYTPSWWKLEGSQYGKLKTWRIGQEGTFIDGVRISDVTIADLDLAEASLDPHADRHRRQGRASRRRQHLRQAASATTTRTSSCGCG